MRWIVILKYFLLSRFTRTFLIMTIVFSVFISIAYLSILKILPLNLIIVNLRTTTAEFVTFFSIFSVFSSVVQKADYDFLLVAPLKKETISILYLIASALIGGLFFVSLSLIFLFLYTFPYSIISTLSFVIFGISVSSLSLIRKKVYVIIPTIILVWLPFLHVYYSPTALLFGKVIYGSLSSFLYSIPVLYLSFRKPDLHLSVPSKSLTTTIIKGDFRGGIDFIKSFYLRYYEFVWGYGSAFSGRRLFFYVTPLYKAFTISSLLALLYYSLVKIINPVEYNGIIAPNVLVLAFLSTTGIYSLSQERPWITFISLDIGTYLSRKVLIKTLQTGLLSLPFLVTDYFLGALSMGLALFFGVSLGYFLTSYISSKYNPIQFRGEVYNYRAGSGMLLVIFVDYLCIGITSVSGITIVSSLIYGFLSFLVILFLSRRKEWEKIGLGLIEKGFV